MNVRRMRMRRARPRVLRMRIRWFEWDVRPEA